LSAGTVGERQSGRERESAGPANNIPIFPHDLASHSVARKARNSSEPLAQPFFLLLPNLPPSTPLVPPVHCTNASSAYSKGNISISRYSPQDVTSGAGAGALAAVRVPSGGLLCLQCGRLLRSNGAAGQRVQKGGAKSVESGRPQDQVGPAWWTPAPCTLSKTLNRRGAEYHWIPRRERGSCGVQWAGF